MASVTAEATCALISTAAGRAEKSSASDLSKRLVTLVIVASMAVATLFPLSKGRDLASISFSRRSSRPTIIKFLNNLYYLSRITLGAGVQCHQYRLIGATKGNGKKLLKASLVLHRSVAINPVSAPPVPLLGSVA
ncbi:hypothetical protein PtA15_16A237 [Puccinia triticina]|uniref:Uncharacterized protein n=1 Tax=Puccinia triticina TaxID=208348 RepID=A0ABY7D3Z1_9BASI|nr:uncharacterized protein PtA15_16A237 [Puccinia triticina]WAQ92331.1 hypothetical protein PtA15_16A237 [Puccinia triticina]